MRICLRHGELITVDIFRQNFIITVIDIDLVKTSGKKQEQLVFLVYITQCTAIGFQKLKRLCRRTQYFLLNYILIMIVMIDSGSAVTFMASAVHVTIDHKIDIAVVFHAQKLNVMFRA